MISNQKREYEVKKEDNEKFWKERFDEREKGVQSKKMHREHNNTEDQKINKMSNEDDPLSIISDLPPPPADRVSMAINQD